MKNRKLPTRVRRAIARRLSPRRKRSTALLPPMTVVNRWLVEKREQNAIERKLAVLKEQEQELRARATRVTR